jgi:hypothetical protein
MSGENLKKLLGISRKMEYLKEKINELETNSKTDSITGPYRCKKKERKKET